MHMPQRREYLVGILIVLNAVAITFALGLPQPLFPLIFAPGWDNWFYMGPCAVLMDASISSGEVPLWNPLSFCGTPFAAHPESAVFYPLNLLRSVLIQSSTPFASLLSLVGLSFFHIILAGVGSFFLARAHGVSRAGASVASFVFMFNPTFLRWALELWQYSVCIAWAPILMLLMKSALDETCRRRVVSLSLLSGIILGAGITAGFPQFFIHLCVALFCYGCCYVVFSVPKENRGAIRLGTALVIPFLVAPLVAAIFLVPAVEYVQFIGRGGVQEIAASELFVDRRPLSLLKHFLLFTSDPGMEGRRVAGAGVLFLCLAGLFSTHPKREFWFWGILGLVMLDCSIGRPMPIATLIDVVTQSQMRLPSRLMPFVCLPLGILAGITVDGLQSSRLRIQRSPLIRAIVLGALFSTGVVLLYHWTESLEWLTISRVAILAPALLAVGVLVVPFLPRNTLYCLLFPLLIFVELLAWNHEYLNTMYRRVDLANFGVTAESLQEPVTFWEDNYRSAVKFPNAHIIQLDASMTGFDPLYIKEVRKVLSAPGMEDVYTHWVTNREITEMNHRGHLFAKRSFWLAREYVVGSLPEKDRLFPPTTTVFLSEPQKISVPQVDTASVSPHSVSEDVDVVPLLKMEVDGDRVNVYYRFLLDTSIHKEKHSALVLHFTAEGSGLVETRFTDASKTNYVHGYIYSLKSAEESTEPRILEIPLPAMDVESIEMNIQVEDSSVQFATLQSAEIRIDQRDENQLIHVIERTANRVTVEVGPLDGHRILTFVDAAYPGWEATVDGESTELFTAQQVFKAIEVPPGTHRVVFQYRPMSYRIGKWISCITLLVISVILVRNRRKNVPLEGSSIVQ